MYTEYIEYNISYHFLGNNTPKAKYQCDAMVYLCLEATHAYHLQNYWEQYPTELVKYNDGTPLRVPSLSKQKRSMCISVSDILLLDSVFMRRWSPLKH